MKRISLMVIVATMVAGIAAAQTYSVPNSFSAGGTISASEMNANFTALVNAVNSLKATVTSLQSTLADQATEITALKNGKLSYASGFVPAGTDVTLGNIKVRLSTAVGNRCLMISTGSGTIDLIGADTYMTYPHGIGGSTIKEGGVLHVTTSATNIYSYAFPYGGDMDTWVLRDTENTVAWRITLIVGVSFDHNFISIEKLY